MRGIATILPRFRYRPVSLVARLPNKAPQWAVSPAPRSVEQPPEEWAERSPAAQSVHSPVLWSASQPNEAGAFAKTDGAIGTVRYARRANSGDCLI
jgi:uncharacterized membrane protein